MGDNVAFPFFVCLDDGEVMQIETLERILYHLEAIDIENDEYMFWDAGGRGLKIIIKQGRVSGFEKANNKVTLQQAFDGYANQLAQRGITVDTSGRPDKIWAEMQKAKESIPRHSGVFSRLFRRRAK